KIGVNEKKIQQPRLGLNNVPMLFQEGNVFISIPDRKCLTTPTMVVNMIIHLQKSLAFFLAQ
nr:hypothetical protein [Saprospiraceae bacterium]